MNQSTLLRSAFSSVLIAGDSRKGFDQPSQLRATLAERAVSVKGHVDRPTVRSPARDAHDPAALIFGSDSLERRDADVGRPSQICPFHERPSA